MSTVASIPPAGMPPLPIMRFSVEQYHEMARTGVIEEGAPIELLDGFLVEKTRKTPHRTAFICDPDARRTVAEFDPEKPGSSARMERSRPMTANRSRTSASCEEVFAGYADRHPSPCDVALVVEVADSSLPLDRDLKKTIYARAGIVHYWILNLIDRQLEMFSDPTGPTAKPDYLTTQDFAASDVVPLVIDGSEVGRLKVSDVLP